MIIERTDGKVLMIQEKGEIDTLWKFPQGGIDGEETPEQAVKRELKEEVTITHFKILAKATYVHHYNWPEEMQKRKGYRGQSQSIYLVHAEKPKEAKSGEKKILKLEWVTFDEAIGRFAFENQKVAAKKAWREFELIVKTQSNICNFQSKKGILITIRPVEKNDAPALFTHYQRLIKDKEPIATMGTQQGTVEGAISGMDQKLERIQSGTFFEIVVLHKEKIIGNGGWYRSEGSTGHLAFIFFSLDKEFRGQGIAKKAAEIILENAQQNPTIRKMVAEIYSINTPSIGLCKRLGFETIGTRKEWYNYHGKYVDEIVMEKIVK